MQQLPRQGDSSQASAFQLLRAAPALVMHEVMPLGCALGQVYLSKVQLHLSQQLTLSCHEGGIRLHRDIQLSLEDLVQGQLPLEPGRDQVLGAGTLPKPAILHLNAC